MKAFHDDPAIKEKYLLRLKAHYEADEIIKGKYWEEGKGCAVGCTIHGNSHFKYETELGIPQVIARLEDGIFENLPNEMAKEFPTQFLEAIPVGADLSLIWPKFAVWLLGDPKDGVSRFARTKEQKDSIDTVVELYKKQIDGERVDLNIWNAAANAADAAAYAAANAADAAADAAAYAAAYAADAAANAAANAACAAANAAYAAAAAIMTARITQRDKLLELLREAH